MQRQMKRPVSLRSTLSLKVREKRKQQVNRDSLRSPSLVIQTLFLLSSVFFFFWFVFLLPFSFCSPESWPLPPHCKSCLCSAATRRPSSPCPRKRLRRTADSGLCWPASERRVSADVRSKQKAARLSKSEERQIDVAAPSPSLSPRHPQDSQTLRATKWTTVADPRLFYTGVVSLA